MSRIFTIVLALAVLLVALSFLDSAAGKELSSAARRLEEMKTEYFKLRWESEEELSSRDLGRIRAFLDKWAREIDGEKLAARDRRDFLVMLHRAKATLEWRRLCEEAAAGSQADYENGAEEGNSDPTPEHVFAYRFKHQFGIETTPLRAARVAQKEWHRTWERLEGIARAWWKDSIAASGAPVFDTAGLTDMPVSWQRLDELMKSEHPLAKDLLKHAEKSLREARDFVVQKGIVTVPEYARHVGARWGSKGAWGRTVPFGYYQPDYSDDSRGAYRGYFVISPLDRSLSEEDQEQFLCGNNLYWTRVVALHEAIPGHHLQFAVAARTASRVQRSCYNPAFVEGWALYCEGMMARNGYFNDLKTRLAQQKMRLWRCARVLIDLGLHVGGMSKKEAEQLLIEKVGLEPFAARREVSRYKQVPFYQSAYLLGCLEIESMRRALEMQFGEAFDQRDFHDRILNCAPIPLAIVRDYMLQ